VTSFPSARVLCWRSLRFPTDRVAWPKSLPFPAALDPVRMHERTPGALPVEDLLPQDVCVPAVLGEFAQYVEVHPAQRERAAPVAVDPVVQP
jgi:hypothetical protein